jgi:hypothetical protein
MPMGATQQFAATAEMSDGSTSTTGFNWSVEGGGAVSVSGMYTAPSASQSTPATITATKSTKKGTATVNQIYEPATIVSRGPITGKIGGSTTAFTTMFTATNSTFDDYEFVITPPSAGSFTLSGVFSLDNDASGTVTVKATHKTQTSVTATTSFTGVVAKAGIISKGPITAQQVGGSSIPFSTLFTLINSVADDYRVTVSPEENGSYVSGNIVLTNNASGSTVVTAIHKTQGNAAETCTISNITPKATIVGKTVTGRFGGSNVLFTDMFTSNKPSSDYTYVVNPTTNVTINNTTGVLTLGDEASGNYTITATHKTQAGVTATANVNGVTTKATITAAALTDKVGGDVIPFVDMFTSNKPASEFNFVLTPTGDVGSINTTTGALTLALAPTDELMNVKATHKTQTSVTATATITATPKLMGLVAAAVTNAVVVGDIELPSVTDTIMITDHTLPATVRIDTVPQGAVVSGVLAYDAEGTDTGLLGLTFEGNLLRIRLSGAITSEDTKVTIRTMPSSDVFRTYILKSGE